MKHIKIKSFKTVGYSILVLLLLFSVSNTVMGCQKKDMTNETGAGPKGQFTDGPPTTPTDTTYKLPNIDLSHWKVTLPIRNALEIEPPKILHYATNEILKKFMYNDSTDGSLVFYTYPASTTGNTTYSRTELREQMTPGSDNDNWTLEEGGRMKGTLSVPSISKDENGDFDRTIVMQIHGRLTDKQAALIGQKDNNAPPILKIYWYKGKIRVLSKVLKNEHASDKEILHTDAWVDKGFNFSKQVGNNKFTLEIIASKGKIKVILDGDESKIYDNNSLKRWNVFENYFKAGNYLSSTNKNSFAKVKYYKLEVSH